MKKIGAITVILISALLAGCNEDGVPKLADPHHPVVDGKAMTTGEFLNKYCAGNKRGTDTCTKVVDASWIDTGNGEGHVPLTPK